MLFWHAISSKTECHMCPAARLGVRFEIQYTNGDEIDSVYWYSWCGVMAFVEMSLKTSLGWWWNRNQPIRLMSSLFLSGVGYGGRWNMLSLDCWKGWPIFWEKLSWGQWSHWNKIFTKWKCRLNWKIVLQIKKKYHTSIALTHSGLCNKLNHHSQITQSCASNRQINALFIGLCLFCILITPSLEWHKTLPSWHALCWP